MVTCLNIVLSLYDQSFFAIVPHANESDAIFCNNDAFKILQHYTFYQQE